MSAPTDEITTTRIRVLVADDEHYLRKGFRSYLDTDDIEVVGEAGSGPEAVTLARHTGADVVLMDLRMLGGSGIDATHELTRNGRDQAIAVLAITTFDTDENVFGAIEHGASGVLLKTVDPDELIAAVRAAARGQGWITPELLPRVLNEFRRRRVPELPEHVLADTGLSEREVQLLHLLTKGLSNDELAERLEVSIGTVKGLLTSIKKKLNLGERRHLVVWAFNNGLDHPTGGEVGQVPSPDTPERR